MLIRFEVSNFRSISEPIELSLVAIDDDQPSARSQARMKEHILTRAAIYGPNASGKSSVLAAIDWLSRAIGDSLRRWDEGIPIQPHAFGDWPAKTSHFVVDLAIDGIRYEYELELDAERIHYEALFEYPEGRRKRVFQRDENALTLQSGLGKLSGARELITDRTLALSAMRRFASSKVGSVIKELTQIENLSVSARRRPYIRFDRITRTEELFDTDKQQPPLFQLDGEQDVIALRDRALALLRLADLGVADVAFQEVPFTALNGEIGLRRVPQLLHKTAGADQPLDLDQESDGTTRWFRLIGPALGALQRGSLVLVDEVDASLHPVLAAELLRLFSDHETNPHDAQIIFTSHDTSLLSHLNRDEVWLTEKQLDGSTRLGALSDFAGGRPRRSQDLGDAYLAGRFGALPDTDRTELLQALGLLA